MTMHWPFSRGKTVFLVLILLTAGAVAILRLFKPAVPEFVAPPEEKVAVTVYRAARETIEDRITLPGRTEPLDEIIVAAEQSGRVLAVQAAEGRPVSEGSELLRIDDRLWHMRLENAEIRLRDAGRGLRRAEELFRDGAVSQSDLEAAQTAAEAAGIARDEALIQLEYCRPSAPANGIVEQVYVSAGEYVQPGQPVVRILVTDRMKVLFDVPERDLSRARADGAYEVEWPSLSGQRMTGQVEFIASSANPGNNAYRVELLVDNPEGLLRGGLFARVDFHRGTVDDAILLPLEAIVPMEGEYVVYLVEEDRAVRRVVRLGRILDSRAILREGVRDGDRVILDGNRAVLDGTPVIVMEDWAPAPIAE